MATVHLWQCLQLQERCFRGTSRPCCTWCLPIIHDIPVSHLTTFPVVIEEVSENMVVDALEPPPA